jgi:multiple sugar transport system ATP-binding protein
MAEVEYVSATCLYPGNPVPAVDKLDLEIKDGEFMVLVGPSGSGKSTALRMLAGLEDVSEGEIRIGGQDVSRKAPKDRDVFLMDEPLSNLDAKLRVETRANIAALQSRLGTTTLYVTHDQVEAMTMGHRVAVLRDGLLQQVDTPRALYDTPGNVFVAGFIGSPAMNMRSASITDEGARIGEMTVPLSGATMSAAREAGLSEIELGIRPEGIDISDKPTGLSIVVELVEELGADEFVYGSVPGEDEEVRHLVARPHGKATPRYGETIHLTVDSSQVHAFHPESGQRLGDS